MKRLRLPLSLIVMFSLTGCVRTGPGYRQPARAPGEARIEALLVNGGARKERNYRSHLEHLRILSGLLLEAGLSPRAISVFNADGAAPAPDVALREEGRFPNHWLLQGSMLGRSLPDLIFETSTIEGVRLLPSKKAALETWFHTMADELAPGDTLLLYVTDHGLRMGRKGEVQISLWHERLALSELKAWLDELDPGVRVVLWMSQCYSGAFADLMYSDSNGLEVKGNTCGFFSTLPRRLAWGCFPEAPETKELKGHSFRMLEGLSPGATLDAAHRRTLLADHTPNVPNRTSDAFLRSLLAREARNTKQPVDRVADGLLARAWSKQGCSEWEKQTLDELGKRLGAEQPIRSLMDLAALEKEVRAGKLRAGKFRARWASVVRSLVKATVKRFQEESPLWEGRTLREIFAAQGLRYANTAEAEVQRRELTDQALSDVISYISKIDGLRERLDRLRQRAILAGGINLRMARREGMLQRMRVVLESMAGAVLAEQDADLAQAHNDLLKCEAWRLPGGPAVEPESPEPGPGLGPLAEDLVALEKLRPSWLGVRYGPEDGALVAQHGLGKGAVVVRSVVPGSPAEASGLKAADTIVGPVDRPFQEPDSLRETVMQHPRGEVLTLDVLRSGKRIQVKVGLEVFPDVVPKAPAKLELDSLAPDFTGLKSFRGTAPKSSPVLLFFYATWCGPCKAAAPTLIAWEQEHGIPVVAVTHEGEEVVSEFFGSYKKPFPERLAIDPRGLITDAYRATAFPTMVLVGADGKVKAYGRGAKALEREGFKDPD